MPHLSLLERNRSDSRAYPVHWLLTMAVFEPLFKALNDADIRYVVVGGLASSFTVMLV